MSHLKTRIRARITFGLLAVGVLAAVHVLSSGGYVKANVLRVSPSMEESTWFVDMNRFAQSAHATFKCSECHGTMTEGDGRHPDEARPDFLKQSATRTYDYSRCRKCHEVAYKRYQKGGHAKARQERKPKSKAIKQDTTEKRTAPTCGNCHVSHYVRSGLSRIDVGRRMIAVCEKCHPAHTSSYLDNTHGKLGINLGNTKAAFCTDCHGAHSVNSLEKQPSALTVCRRCHPKAEKEFTNIVIHASLESASVAETEKIRSIVWIQRVRWISIAVVAFSLVFFIGHGFLWLLREIHAKLRKH